MNKLGALILIAFCISSCADKSKDSHKVSFSLSIDDKQLQPAEYKDDFRIRYLTTLDSDTVEVFPEDRFIDLPNYDSTIVFFEVAYENHTIGFTGEMLKVEVPGLLDTSLTFWEFQLDTPPFIANYDNRKDKDSIEAACFLKHDRGDWRWLSLENK